MASMAAAPLSSVAACSAGSLTSVTTAHPTASVASSYPGSSVAPVACSYPGASMPSAASYASQAASQPRAVAGAAQTGPYASMP